MQKADSKSSAGTTADSGQDDEFSSVSQHSRKLPVVCSQFTVSRNELPKEFFDDDIPISVLQEDGSIKPTSYTQKNIRELLKVYYPELWAASVL
jgi:hypothetical protein